MRIILTFHPIAEQSNWLMSLKVNQGTSRVLSLFRKLNKVHHLAKHGSPQDVLALSRWQQAMQALQVEFDKATRQYQRLIQRKMKTCATASPVRHMNFRLPISDISGRMLYQTLCQYDDLMVSLEACLLLGIFKKRGLLVRKRQQYSAPLLQLFDDIAQFNAANLPSGRYVLTPTDKNALSFALQMADAPLFERGVFNQLIAQINVIAKEKTHE